MWRRRSELGVETRLGADGTLVVSIRQGSQSKDEVQCRTPPTTLSEMGGLDAVLAWSGSGGALTFHPEPEQRVFSID